MDLSEIHKNIFALSDNWRPTLGQRPPVGTQGFLHPNFDTMPMMGYHATKLRNFESVVEYGLFPGGLSADGSPGRVFVMMSAAGFAQTIAAPGRPPRSNLSSTCSFTHSRVAE